MNSMPSAIQGRAQQEIAQLLEDQLKRLFDQAVSRESLSAAEHGIADPSLWTDIAAIGAAQVLTPEALGGAALSWGDAAGVFQLLGARLAPVALGESMVANWAMGLAGAEIPNAQIAIAGEPLKLDHKGGVNGTASLVSWIPGAEFILVLAQNDVERRLVLVPTSEVRTNPQRTLDRASASQVIFKANLGRVTAAAPTTLGSHGLLAPLAVLRTLQIAGNLTTVLALCIDYSKSRSQFGKKIAAFQAIQHLLAELAEHVALSQVAGHYAARQLDRGDPAFAERAAAIGKLRASRSATRGAAIAHQLFGAIGITDEHILHYYTRRLWQWRAEAGSDNRWAELLGRDAILAGGNAFWKSIVTPAEIALA